MAERRFADLAASIRKSEPHLGRVRLIAVDGPSGAGKTQFAERLAGELRAPVVHTDDLLDGWDDQFTFWTRLEAEVLEPLRQGEPATYRRYDWEAGGFAGPSITVPAQEVVLLEGVSAARRAIRPELTMAIFVSAPAKLRWERAIARDGDDSVAYRKYLERWRTAEDQHFAVDETVMRADLIVDGATASGGGRFTAVDHEFTAAKDTAMKDSAVEDSAAKDEDGVAR